MHGSSYKFSIVWENATNWEIGTLTFLKVWVAFSIRFPSCGILHCMGRAWVFSSNSHMMRKYNKTHYMGETWDIDTHTFTNKNTSPPSNSQPMVFYITVSTPLSAGWRTFSPKF